MSWDGRELGMALRLAGVVLETAPELGLGTMEHAAPREPSVLGTRPARHSSTRGRGSHLPTSSASPERSR